MDVIKSIFTVVDKLLDKLVDLVISLMKFIRKHLWIILVIILAVAFHGTASTLCHAVANIGYIAGIILLFSDSKRAIGKKIIIAAIMATGAGICLKLFGGIIVSLFKGLFKLLF